jgi:mannose-1-phosphate guanylyltransferase
MACVLQFFTAGSIQEGEPKMETGQLWTIVLAAGEGRRVRDLTTDGQGSSAPKQFCAPSGEQTMLEWTTERAARLVPRERIVVVVAEQHRCWWEPQLAGHPAGNVVVQPADRGTAAGILLPFVAILRRDPMARVLVLPSDHHVDDEEALREAIVDAVDAARQSHDRVILLGVVADGSEADYGWIVPEDPGGRGGLRPVAAFVEKPEPRTARLLARRGALLNSFIFVATSGALLGLYDRAVPWLLREFTAPHDGPGDGDLPSVEMLYRALPSCDFSREVLEHSTDHLSVVQVRRCGFTDLGHPARLLHFREREATPAAAEARVPRPGH